MKKPLFALLAGLLLGIPAAVQAQFDYATNNNAITVTEYTGFGGDVAIPATVNGLPVTSIGDGAFSQVFDLQRSSVDKFSGTVLPRRVALRMKFITCSPICVWYGVVYDA
jgi:hypothetical protein